MARKGNSKTGWDAETVQKLRRHLGSTQQQMAQTIETRQQTISEWETALVSRCLRLAEGAPRLEENELTREMAIILELPARNILLGTLRQQGLMHLYRRLLQGVPSSDGSELLKRGGGDL